MDLFSGIGRPMMRLVEKHLFVWFTNLFPFGVGWKLFAACVFVLIATVILTFVTVVLLWKHSREEHTWAVTVPFRYVYGVAGFVFGIMTLVDPKGAWNVVWHIVFILGFMALCGFLYAAIEKMEGAPRSKRYYWCVGLSFAIEMFLIGFYAFTVFIIAVIFALLIVFLIAYFRTALAEMMRPPPPCACGGGGLVSGNERKKLEDGTVIEKNGMSWYEVGGPASYRQNYDGTFTKD